MKHKRIAVLKDGPSLGEYWTEAMRSDYSQVYAVNRAALKYGHDVAGCLDDEMMQALRSHGESNVILSRTGLLSGQYSDLRSLWLYGSKTWMLDDRSIQSDGAECRYCLPCVISWVAESVKNPAIDIFGMDCTVDASHPSTRWYGEIPWVAYALRTANFRVFGEIREDWKEWIAHPAGRLPR